eukprot:CAMPEP_0183524460 /NCGR_PEP_ID=MMETSP0371-20130417/19908_1 /TAXON_ID=268820 /ORGANISM="Peridinium aciculiferum, Strain PAER-2" /LENGTH=30 /DNA_ID= /DNA_START= /DNA_END= /DNA_ORIENTATION=
MAKSANIRGCTCSGWCCDDILDTEPRMFVT